MPQWDLLMKYRFSCEIPKSYYTCILPRLKKRKIQPPPPVEGENARTLPFQGGGCKKGLAVFWNIWLFKDSSHTGVLYA